MAFFGNFFLAHGWCLWWAWSLFGLVQIGSNRWFKGVAWKQAMWIHRVSGAVILAITVYYALKAWQTLGWKVLPNAHSVFVFPTLFSVGFVALGGIASRTMLRGQIWNTRAALLVKSAHRIFAYLLLLVS